MPILRIEKPVETKEEFDKIKECSQLPDETWTFIEKEELFSEKVSKFSNKFCADVGFDDDEIFTDFVNYLRDIEKKENTQELEIRIEARNMYTDVNMGIGENKLEELALHFYKKGLEQKE